MHVIYRQRIKKMNSVVD